MVQNDHPDLYVMGGCYGCGHGLCRRWALLFGLIFVVVVMCLLMFAGMGMSRLVIGAYVPLFI